MFLQSAPCPPERRGFSDPSALFLIQAPEPFCNLRRINSDAGCSGCSGAKCFSEFPKYGAAFITREGVHDEIVAAPDSQRGQWRKKRGFRASSKCGLFVVGDLEQWSPQSPLSRKWDTGFRAVPWREFGERQPPRIALWPGRSVPISLALKILMIRARV